MYEGRPVCKCGTRINLKWASWFSADVPPHADYLFCVKCGTKESDMNLDPAMSDKAMRTAGNIGLDKEDTAMVDETTTENTTAPQVEAEPPIIQAGFEAPVAPFTIDEAVDFRIASALAPVVAELRALEGVEAPKPDFSAIEDEVYDKAIGAINDFDFSRKFDDVLDNWMTYEFRPGDHDILCRDDFDPSDYDLVTEYDIQGIKESVDELTSSMDTISDKMAELGSLDGDAAVDPTELQDTIDRIEDRLQSIEDRLDAISTAAMA